MSLRLVLVLSLLPVVAACSGSSSSTDAAPKADAAQFTCSQVMCEQGNQYCYVVQSGANPLLVLDAGTLPSADAGVAAPGCNEMPVECRTSPSCTCLMLHSATTCTTTAACSGTGGQLTITCPLP